MRKLKDILLEVMGVQMSIYRIAPNISEEILNRIHLFLPGINDGHEYDFTYIFKMPEDILKDTKIETLTTVISFKNSDSFKIDGSFSTTKTHLLDNGNYNISIELKIHTNTLDNLLPKIESIIVHELNHAFVTIKQVDKKNKSNSLNYANKMTNGMLKDLISNNLALKEFVRMFYLSNPLEVQARVQQAATELKSIEDTKTEDVINQLMKYNPLVDAGLMTRYNLDEIKKTKKEDLELFIKTFNENLKSHSKGEIKLINDVDNFFDYWLKTINIAGNDLSRKIFKLVANKQNMINESYIYIHLDPKIVCRVLGYENGFYFQSI